VKPQGGGAFGSLARMGEIREVRLAKNEEFHRAANDALERESTWSDPDLICECSRRGCVERVVLTKAEYEHVRAKNRQFFVVPGHENPAVEVVVERHPTHLIVEKVGEAGVYADHHHPPQP
jgi:hypothetical protein